MTVVPPAVDQPAEPEAVRDREGMPDGECEGEWLADGDGGASGADSMRDDSLRDSGSVSRPR